MYEKVKVINLKGSVAPQAKNLQVVSFDSNWKEVYIGASRKDTFMAVCPNNVPDAQEVTATYKTKDKEHVIISSAKWCPMESCTVLVLGSQHGIQIYDWNGSNMILDFAFASNDIKKDEKEIIGFQARGIAAVGSSYLAVGLHSGDILMFCIELHQDNYICNHIGKFKNHVDYITELASSTIQGSKYLASGDSNGIICIWKEVAGQLVQHKKIQDWQGFPVTTFTIWNRYKDGLLIAGYGNGMIRMFDLNTAKLLCEISGHCAWITGMDLASSSGLLLTCSEDGYVRVWQLSLKGTLIEHWYSQPIPDSLLMGAKFLDPNGSTFCLSSFDTSEIQIYRM